MIYLTGVPSTGISESRKRAGIWEQVNASLRRQVRVRMGRDPEPSAAVLDSQSVKTSPVRGDERGYDAAKSANRFAEISMNC